MKLPGFSGDFIQAMPNVDDKPFSRKDSVQFMDMAIPRPRPCARVYCHHNVPRRRPEMLKHEFTSKKC